VNPTELAGRVFLYLPFFEYMAAVPISLFHEADGEVDGHREGRFNELGGPLLKIFRFCGLVFLGVVTSCYRFSFGGICFRSLTMGELLVRLRGFVVVVFEIFTPESESSKKPVPPVLVDTP
jgi:hypothetical protein